MQVQLKAVFTEGNAVHEVNLATMEPSQQPPPQVQPPGWIGPWPPTLPWQGWQIGNLHIWFYQNGNIVISYVDGATGPFWIVTITAADLAWLFSSDS